MEPNKYEYEIGGKKYIQKPLVLGQVNQLMATLRNVVLPKSLDMQVLIASLGNKLPTVLAIVLIEDPVPDHPHPPPKLGGGYSVSSYLRDRDIAALADELEFDISPELTVQVADDFFDCNPILSLLEKFARLGEKIGGKIEKIKTGSTSSPSSSPPETSPGATQ